MNNGVKTFTSQDLALGTAMLQHAPLKAMTPQEKQFLIDNKKLLEILLAHVLTKIGELAAAMAQVEEFRVWTSESMADDPFAEDENCDAVELWFKILFAGLTPFVTRELRFVTGVYAEERKIIRILFQDETEQELPNDSGQVLAQSELLEVSVCACLAEVVLKMRSSSEKIEVLNLLINRGEPGSAEFIDDPLFTVETKSGDFDFY